MKQRHGYSGGDSPLVLRGSLSKRARKADETNRQRQSKQEPQRIPIVKCHDSHLFAEGADERFPILTCEHWNGQFRRNA